jgi:hypothetical protein
MINVLLPEREDPEHSPYPKKRIGEKGENNVKFEPQGLQYRGERCIMRLPEDS